VSEAVVVEERREARKAARVAQITRVAGVATGEARMRDMRAEAVRVWRTVGCGGDDIVGS
jgi:hypothetical protein